MCFPFCLWVSRNLASVFYYILTRIELYLFSLTLLRTRKHIISAFFLFFQNLCHTPRCCVVLPPPRFFSLVSRKKPRSFQKCVHRVKVAFFSSYSFNNRRALRRKQRMKDDYAQERFIGKTGSPMPHDVVYRISETVASAYDSALQISSSTTPEWRRLFRQYPTKCLYVYDEHTPARVLSVEQTPCEKEHKPIA
jgi:hypothetical protein